MLEEIKEFLNMNSPKYIKELFKFLIKNEILFIPFFIKEHKLVSVSIFKDGMFIEFYISNTNKYVSDIIAKTAAIRVLFARYKYAQQILNVYNER